MWHIIILIQHCELTSAGVNYSVSSAYFKVRWCRLRTSSGVHFNNYFQEGAGLCAESKPGWNWWGRLSADPIHNPPSVHNLLWLLRLWQEIPTQATQGSNCACQDSIVPVLVSWHTRRCWLCWPARSPSLAADLVVDEACSPELGPWNHVTSSVRATNSFILSS